MRRKAYINWAALGTKVCDDRAEGRCECTGHCRGRPSANRTRCTSRHGHVDEAGEWVKLTPVPLDGVAYHVEISNLLAMCQACRRRFEALARQPADEPEGLFDLPESKGGGVPTL